MWQAFVDLIAQGLSFFNNILAGIGVPYSFGFAIILFTLVIKALTYPLNQQQMKSARATQELQPKLKELQKKYANDKEKLAQAQMELYKEAGVNPLGGCLPMLVQMPIWFALYRALFQLASQTDALNEGFFWIPSLAGPVTDRSAGLSWLWPFVNGAPPIGWVDAIGYLVLPVLLVVTQLYMQRMMSPPSDDPQQKAMGQAMMFMPFMFGYFALIVPSGLSLYWFTNNILSMVQQYFVNRSLKADKEAKAAAPANAKSPEQPAMLPAAPEALAGSVTSDTQVQNNGQPKPKPASSKRRRRKRKKQR
ncbi:MAG: membrane protein insertase YidC [Caldilineae bacterium]|nr:MAG: membrane protein insertase YidC [Caldilineae bacterium]